MADTYSDRASNRIYSSQDVQQILRKASMLQGADSVSPEQLAELATEVGIPLEVLKQAEQDWLKERQGQQQQALWQSGQRLGFRLHLIPYIAVSLLLVVINLSTTPRIYWSLYPILGWGMGVAMHAAYVYRKP
ncbi:MAG: 2TM domain-containing protein [Elainella sp.]